MIELAFIVAAFIIAVFSVEYANWRMGRRLSKITEGFFCALGIDYAEWRKLPVEEKKKIVAEQAQKFWKSLFPETPIPAPTPSRLITSRGNEFFVPQCPTCGYAASPVLRVPGVSVEASCPEHGVFKVQIPEKEE